MARGTTPARSCAGSGSGAPYDGVVLDPPTYGHGNGAWRIETDLEPLLEDLAALAGPRPPSSS